MHCNFFVSPDAEGSHGVPGLGLDWLLVSQIFKHLSCFGEFIAGLASAEVKDEFIDFDLSHLVVPLFLLLLLVHIFFLSQLNLLIIIV